MLEDLNRVNKRHEQQQNCQVEPSNGSTQMSCTVYLYDLSTSKTPTQSYTACQYGT